LSEINTIKQGCANIGTCNCKVGEVAQSDKVVLLLQALNTEVKATMNEINLLSTQLRADIRDTTENLKKVMAQYQQKARPCLGRIDDALKNITIAYDKGTEALLQSKADYEKNIANKGATYSDKTFAKQLTQILKLKITFTNLFKRKIVQVTTWLLHCKIAIRQIIVREDRKKKQAERQEAARKRKLDIERKREEARIAREAKRALVKAEKQLKKKK